MANEKNLKPFKKGQSGNPNGRPKTLDIREAMGEILHEEKDGKTALHAILAAQRAKAARGDTKAAELLFKYAFKLPSQEIEQHTSGNMETTIRIIRE